MERLKVLFISTCYPTKEDPVGGVFVREHAKAVQLYDDVHVLHCAGPDPNLRRHWRMQQETDESLTERIPTHRVWYRSPHLPKIWYFIYISSTFMASRRIASQGFRPDIIHAHFYEAGVPAALIGKIYHIPVVVTEHYSGFPRKIIQGLDKLKARFALKMADIVMPVSKALQKGIEDYGIKARFRVVPNAVDINLFNPGSFAKTANQLKHVLFVGLLELEHKKGVPYLLNALALLRKHRKDWILHIVGDGPARLEYERMAEAIGLDDKVVFHGLKTKGEVAEFMRNADLFVLPSPWENMPCVLIEAMASGLPIVSTLTGGIPEIVHEGVGILIPPEDAARLSDALAQMLSSLNEFDRRTVAQKALAYSSESIGKLIHSIYKDCLRG